MPLGQLDDKAQRILRAAFELAEEGGFEAVRLRDVAQRAEVALGTLYNRFSSKEEMLVTALDESTKTFAVLVEALESSAPTAAARVSELLVLKARALFNRPNFGRAVMRAAAGGGPEVTSRIYSHQSTISKLLLARIRGHVSGTPPTKDEAETCHLLQQISFACLLAWSNGMRSEDEVISDLQAAAQRLVRKD
jgi:AcrR family transcriptional regulator